MSATQEQNLSAWIKTCTDDFDLMHEGPRRIAEITFRNCIFEERMVMELSARLAALGVKVGKAAVKRQIKTERKEKTARDKRASQAPPRR